MYSICFISPYNLIRDAQPELLTLALLINSIIGLDQWWDNAQETLSWTRIPLPAFGNKTHSGVFPAGLVSLRTCRVASLPLFLMVFFLFVF